jgi:hypothetical protein
MTRSRRKKILIWTLLIILLLLVMGYAFRYPLIRQYQYKKLKSLRCINYVTKEYTEDTNCLSRIGAHRVNSPERYDILKDKFHVFETDIVYDDSLQTYYVYHPPKPDDGEVLTLKEFLRHVDFNNIRHHRVFWLDTRGIDSSNMWGAIKAMVRIESYIKDSIPNSGFTEYNILLEMYDLTAARFFAENGFAISFNPSERLLQRMITDTLLRDSVNKVMGKIAWVSQDYRYISFLKQFFPDKTINTWRPEFEVFINTKELQQLLDDPRIGLILVSIKSRYYK